MTTFSCRRSPHPVRPAVLSWIPREAGKLRFTSAMTHWHSTRSIHTTDPLTQILGNVGQSLGNLMLNSLAGPAELAGWDGELLSRYGAQSPVLLNQCGSWGDPGTGDASWIFFLPEQSIKSLIGSEQPLEHLLAVRANWMGYRGPTLSAYGSLSQLTAVITARCCPLLPSRAG